MAAPYVAFKVFVFVGLFSLLLKGNHLLFILLSLELLAISCVLAYTPLLIEVSFIVLLTFAVLSSLLGVLSLVKLLGNYGNDIVLWYRAPVV